MIKKTGMLFHCEKVYSSTDLYLIFLFFLLHTADLKRTIAVLLDDILTRLVKLEGKIESVVNASSTNVSNTAGGLDSAPAALQKSSKQEIPGSHQGTSRLHPHVPNRPLSHHGA